MCKSANTPTVTGEAQMSESDMRNLHYMRIAQFAYFVKYCCLYKVMLYLKVSVIKICLAGVHQIASS